VASVTVTDDGELRGPDLPAEIKWPEATRRWWDTWRRSPQAQTFTATDWTFLLDTAVLHSEFWLGDKSVAAELRLRVAKFGATPEDRARLRLNIGGDDAAAPAVKTPATVKKTAARRERLLRSINGEAAG
jgi:hypothetical protein